MTACRRRVLRGALLCVICMPASVAAAAGPPLPSSVSGKVGAVAPGGGERMITRGAGEDTLVVAVERGDRDHVLRAGIAPSR